MPRRPRIVLDRRQQGLVLAAVATGVLVGLVVAGFERLADGVVLHRVLDAPVWVQAVAPGIGLVLTVVILRFVSRDTSPATADEYVKSFHDRRPLSLRPVPGRLLAGVATVGSGGALGLEGPSIYAGAAIGSGMQRRLAGIFRRDDAKVLMVCGAAAGVAAIFKAPATGVIFALEVPYTDDVARRALIPALVASAASYLTFVTLVGATPLFSLRDTGESTQFNLADLGGALALGILAGVLARGFAGLVHQAKRIASERPLLVRLPVGAVVLGGLVVVAQAVFEAPLTLGPGYDVFRWVASPDRTLVLIALLFALRGVATLTTLAAGGTGGLFIPLAVQGMLLGRFVAGVVGSASTLFPVIGLAAFLGAGYRTPIASVMFVAETTGRALYVVPALVAAAASQLLIGRATVSSGQQSVRSGHLERRFRLPISTALSTDVLTVPPDASAAELVWTHVVARRERAVPVVDEATYLGMARIEEVSELDRSTWETTPVTEVMRTDLPLADPSWTLRDAVVAMEAADVDRLAVADARGTFVGVVLLAEIVKLDEILDETGG
ncbi:MAG TPA: chloride channel protein [Acidimicrobiales bacterium]|nr:chloride channel protein [Acidimicrobiales bacterium]